MPPFEIIVGPTNREVIARGSGIRRLAKIRAKYGDGDWIKCKGEATIAWPDGKIERVELHWFEAHGIGRRLIKSKGKLDR